MVKLLTAVRGVGSAGSVARGARAAAASEVSLAAKLAPVADAFESTTPRVMLVQRAVSKDDVARCRQLLFSSYVTKGYLEPDPVLAKAAGTFYQDQTHASPAARRRGQTFFVEAEDGTVAATGTLIRDTPQHVSRVAKNYGLPLDASVPEELETLRRELPPGSKLAELGGLAAGADSSGLASVRVLKALRGGAPESHPVTALFEAAKRHARAQGVTDLVMGVHPTHAKFYERIGFRECKPLLGGARADYTGLQNAEVVLLHAKVDEISLSLYRYSTSRTVVGTASSTGRIFEKPLGLTRRATELRPVKAVVGQVTVVGLVAGLAPLAQV